MELNKKLPISFFEKVRKKNVLDESFDNIIPIKWSKDVMNGKKEATVKLPKERENNNDITKNW